MGVEGEIRSDDHLPSAALWHTNYHVSKWHRPVVQDNQQLSIPIRDDYCQSVLFSGWVAATGTGMGQRKCLKEGWAWYGMVLKLMQSPIHTNTPFLSTIAWQGLKAYIICNGGLMCFFLSILDCFFSGTDGTDSLVPNMLRGNPRCHGPKLDYMCWERAMPCHAIIYRDIYIYISTPIKKI